MNPQEIADPFTRLKSYLTATNRKVFIACETAGQRERMQTLLLRREMHAVAVDAWKDAGTIKGKSVGLLVLPLEQSIEGEGVVLIAEEDLLGERLRRAARKKRKAETFLAEMAGLEVGELVVHKDHGIGRFDGLETLEVQGARHDCLKLVYDGGDKLFLPVENADLITRYGEGDAGALDKLGGASWQARKARFKERIKLAAEALLKVAAERALRQATELVAEPGSYEEFCARFPYAETEDQQRAIEDTLEDMAQEKPMDRLICGDVGFGKTEVALRAAFVATQGAHKTQVAVVVPTTLLCRQHTRTFIKRFEGMGVTIRQLSRLVSAREMKETREMVADGRCDIVIGTHALLGKGMAFERLGLLIIDEEQHFGVAQKEHLKNLKADVHVLTLSATPLPRTLQMSLAGIRELSLITTPPVDRLAVRTFVGPFDPVVVREAILRERARGGQVFYVAPYIEHLAEMRAKLTELAPEARVAVAHGQLGAGELDARMNDFYDGKIDVLLSTAIVESGLDIPTANTMIVHRADLFGLGQLYQLRGRVGRAKQRAYAYFTVPYRRTLSRAAEKRLAVMQTLDTLGAGFTVASHDMDIRGYGNLLGDEQSGHIREVGVELYQQMLEEAVAAARAASHGEAEADERWSPQINLGMSVLIPEEYVPDLSQRLGLYRRAAGLMVQEDIDAFAAELVDRFGPLPEEVAHLLAIMRLKHLCRTANIEKLDTGPKGMVVTFRKNTFARPEALLSWVTKHPNTVKLRPDQRLFLAFTADDDVKKLDAVNRAVGEIVQLAV